jgi:hypothetical protein
MPAGFLLLGVLLVLMGALCTSVVVAMPGDDVPIRAACGLIALLSLVLVEALWYVRPWVARAADAWAAGCVAVFLLPAMADAVLNGLKSGDLVEIAIFVGLPCVAVRWYVRDRARKLGFLPRAAATPAARVAVPAPRP